MRQVIVGDPRARIDDRQHPGRGQLHPDLAVAGRELHRVVQQVRDGAFQRGGIAQDRHRLQARVEGDVRSATGRPGQRRLHHLRHVEPLRLALEMVIAGQRHQVTDEGRELTELGGDVVENLGAGTLRQHPGLVVGHQQLNVGAHRRQRGAQLVAGVGDQLSLLLPRSLETLQHQVETARQLTQVVASVDADRVQLVGLGDVLHRGGETTHRGQCGLRHPQGGEGGGHDTGQPGQRDHQPQRVQRRSQRRQGTCVEDGVALHLAGAVPGPHRNRDQAVLLAVRQFHGTGPVPLLHAGDGDLPGVREQRQGLLASLGGLTPRGGDGQQLLGRSEPRAEVVEIPDVGVDDLGGGARGRKHLAVQLVSQRDSRGQISGGTDQEHGCGHGNPGQRGQPGAERLARDEPLDAPADPNPERADHGAVSRST